MYYTYRYFFPAKQIKNIRDLIPHGTYFKRQTYIQEHDIPAKSLLVVHPHGIFCLGWTLNVVFKQEDCYFLIAWILLKVPILHEIMSGFGAQSIDKQNMLRLMK